MRLLVCLLLLLPNFLWAGVVPQPVPTTDTLLQGFLFGQAPDDEMICIKGPCLDTGDPDDASKIKTIVSSYQKPVDITHLAGVAISSPRYDFYDHYLFRVSFSLFCSEADSPACIKAVAEDLQESLGMALAASATEARDDEQVQLLCFSNASGINVNIDRRKSHEGWSNTYVAIYNYDLMNQVRQAANPNYQLR